MLHSTRPACSRTAPNSGVADCARQLRSGTSPKRWTLNDNGYPDLFVDLLYVDTDTNGKLLGAIETKAPAIAKNIRSLDIKDWTTVIGFLTAVIYLILSLSKVWDQPPPSPTVIQQIVVNQITNVIQVPPAPK